MEKSNEMAAKPFNISLFLQDNLIFFGCLFRDLDKSYLLTYLHTFRHFEAGWMLPTLIDSGFELYISFSQTNCFGLFDNIGREIRKQMTINIWIKCFCMGEIV